jgi:hypothetical protein
MKRPLLRTSVPPLQARTPLRTPAPQRLPDQGVRSRDFWNNAPYCYCTLRSIQCSEQRNPLQHPAPSQWQKRNVAARMGISRFSWPDHGYTPPIHPISVHAQGHPVEVIGLCTDAAAVLCCAVIPSYSAHRFISLKLKLSLGWWHSHTPHLMPRGKGEKSRK